MSEPASNALDLAPRHEVGLHRLRRWRAGELSEPERAQVAQHVDACPSCQARIAEFGAEDAQVRAVLPLARLTEGVARPAPGPRRARPWAPRVAMALAAGLAFLALPVALRPPPGNRLKGGGSELQLYVGGVGEPRRVLGEAALQTGERVRLEYRAGEHRYLAVLSIDEQGEVTPLYPETGPSRPITRGEARMLPDSVAFDGPGRERLVAVFSDQPLQVDDLRSAARARFGAAGTLGRMGPLGLGDEEIDRVVIKPGTP